MADEARMFAASLAGAASWLNRLERLHALVAENTQLAAACLREDPATQQLADELLQSVEQFEHEFFGDREGRDHPEAVEVSDAPLAAPELVESARRLTAASAAVAEVGGVLKIDGPVTPELVQEFADALYEVQEASRAPAA